MTTKNWERPTSFNTMLLHSIGSGHGSLVLYNQGSAFHYKLTGKKDMNATVSKYGGYRGLAAHMAAKAQQHLSPPTCSDVDTMLNLQNT